MNPSQRLWVASVREAYPAPGDPWGIAAVSRRYRECAQEADLAHRTLGTLAAVDDQWRGTAAEEFRGSLHSLLPRLQQASDSFGQASSALAVYGRALEEIQQHADVLRPRLQAAETGLRAHPSTWTGDPREQMQAEAAQQAMDAAVASVADLVHRYEAIVRTCRSSLEEAHAAGFHETLLTWLEAHHDDLEMVKSVAEWTDRLCTAAALASLVVPGAQAAAPIFFGAAKVATGISMVAEVGLAAAEYSETGAAWNEETKDLAVDAAFSVVSWGAGKAATGVVRTQIATQVSTGREGLRVGRPDVWLPAVEKAGRIREIEPLVVHGVGDGAGLVLDAGKDVVQDVDGLRRPRAGMP